MKYPSVADIVFLEIATTLCILALKGTASVEQFLWITGIVFGAYYVHKAQNKTVDASMDKSILPTN